MEENFIKRILQRIDPRQPETKTWLLVIYLVFASYLIYDGVVYMLSPESGRITTFVCKPDAAQHNICAVTIYGFREIYRRSFPAEEFVSAQVTMVCCPEYGITFSTKQGHIEFIPPIKSARYIHTLAKEINDQFIDGQPTPTLSITYNGLSFTLYLRGILLILGLGILLLGMRARRPWFRFTATRLSQGRAYWPFAIHWAKSNFFITLLFSLNLAGGQASFFPACPIVFLAEDHYCTFPTSYLLCFYPLAALLLLRSLIQMHMLSRLDLRISLWWLAAPLAASALPMAIAPKLTVDQCQLIAFPIIALGGDPGTHHAIGIAGYYLATGVIQWLVLRMHLRNAIVWTFMPLIQAALTVLGFMVPISIIDTLINITPVWFFISALIVLFLLAMFIGELVPALCISWLVNRKKLVVASGA
jgi:hypothetical protein